MASNLNFLFFVLFIFILSHCVASQSPEIQTDSSAESIGSPLERALKIVSEELINDFRSAHGLGLNSDDDAVNRYGRSPDNSLYSSSPDHGFQRLVGVKPVLSVCNNPLHITNVEFAGKYLAICISADRSRQVTIGEISVSTNRSSSHVQITGLEAPVMSAAFVDSSKLFVLIADQSRRDGVVVNAFEGDFLSNPSGELSVRPMPLPTPYPNVMKLWYGADGSIRLAVASLPDIPTRRSTFSSTTKFFKWEHPIGFDFIGKVDSFKVSDICPFTYGGKDYIVIVNSAASPSYPEVDSSVYRINFDKPEDLVKVQSIRFKNAFDCEIFDLPAGGNRVTTVAHLAIANNHLSSKGYGSVIYKFSGEKFVPSQVLPTHGATKIKSFKNSATGAFVLLVADVNGVKGYQYNGWTFIPSPLQMNHGAMAPGIVEMDVAPLGTSSRLFICNPRAPSIPNVVDLVFEKDEVLKKWRTASLTWCQNAKSSQFDAQLDALQETLSKDVFYIDQKEPIEIHGDLHLEGSTVDIKGLLSAPYIYNHEDLGPLSHRMTHELHHLNEQLSDLEERVGRATQLLARALRLDRSDQVVSGQYTFENLDVTCSQSPQYSPQSPGEACNIGNIVASKLNGEDVENLSRQIIRIDREQTITHPFITFNHIESVSDVNLFGKGEINGINISNLISKTGPNVINSPITFAAPLAVNSIQVTGLVNGIKFTDETVLLKNADQVISSSITFTSPVKTSNLNVDYVNSQAIRNLLPNIVTIDGDHVIKGRKTFSQINVDGNMHVNSTISDVDLAKIHDNLLWTDSEQTVASNVYLDSLTVGGNLRVDNRINSISLNADSEEILLNRRKQPITVTGHKTFTSYIKVDHLHVKDSLNGLGLIASTHGTPLATEWPDQLNILLRTHHQSIPVRKSIAGSLHLAGHSALQGTINDVDLSDLNNAVLKYDAANSFSGTWSLNGTITFLNGLTVGGTVNGVNISRLYDTSLKLNDHRLPKFAQQFIFDNVIVKNSLACSQVNGLILHQDLMTRDTPQTITGLKTFKNGLHILRDFEITGTFNGLPLSFLNDSLLSSTHQLVKGPKVIQGDLLVNNLYTRSLNGIDLASELILLNSSQEQYISGRKNLKNIKVSHGLNVRQLTVAHKINSVDVNHLFSETMLFNAHQRVTGMKKFKLISIPADSSLVVGSLSGHKFSDLVADAVYKDKSCNITGNITFTGNNNSFKSIQFFKTLDGITDRTYRNNWLLQDTEQEIDGDIILVNKVTAKGQETERKSIEITGNLDMSGNLNGHQVRQLNSSIVKVNEPAIVRGPITFTGAVKANSHVNLSGKLQGVKLSQEALLRSQPTASIFGVKTFTSNLHVTGNLTVNGYLDNILIDDLCENAVRSTGQQTLRYPLKVAGNVSADTLNSGGRVAGVDFKRFIQLCVHKDNPLAQTLGGKKHFKTLWIVAPVATRDGYFGGVKVADLQKNYMSLTGDQIVPSEVTFAKGVNFESPVSVSKNLVSLDGLIHMNGHAYNLTNMRDSTLRIRGDQDITAPFVFKEHVNFARNLYIESPMVNRTPFRWFALRNVHKRQLTGPIEFDQVRANSLMMSEGKKIQGIDLSRASRSVVSQSAGSGGIQDHKHFDHLTVQDLIVTGKLNGLQIDKEHVLLSSPNVNQVINARAIFNHVRVDSRLDSKSINGIELNRWSQDLLLPDSSGNSTIIAPKAFGPVRAKETWTMKLIDGLSVDELNQAVLDKRLEKEALELEKKLEFHQNKLQRIRRFLDHQEKCVDHYTFTREISGRLLEHHSTNGRQLIATAEDDKNGCSQLRVHHLASKLEQSYTQIFNPNLVASIASEVSSDDTTSNFAAIVSVSGSRVRHEQVKCISPSATSALGKYVLQVFYETGTKTYVTLDGHEAPRHIAIVKNTPREICVLVASSPESDVICVSRNKATKHSSLLPSRQFATAYLSEWRYTCVASITMSDVRINKWNTNERKLGESIQIIKLMTPERDTHSIIHFTSSYVDPKYLVIAEARSAKVRDSRPLIRFFKRQSTSALVTQPFIETQQTHESSNVVSISSLTSANEDILFLLTSDYSVKVYRLQGASGWIESDTLSLESLDITRSVMSSGWSPERGGHWLALSSHVDSTAVVETAIGSRPSH